MKEIPIDEISILADNDAVLGDCHSPDFSVSSAIGGGQFERVKRIDAECRQLPGETLRQLCIHDEHHTASGSLRLVRTSRAAQAYTACKSAGSRSS